MSRECSTCQSTGVIHVCVGGDDEWVHSDCPDCDGGVPAEWAEDVKRMMAEFDERIKTATSERDLILAMLDKHLWADPAEFNWEPACVAFADELVAELARWRAEQPVDYDQEVTHQWIPMHPDEVASRAAAVIAAARKVLDISAEQDAAVMNWDPDAEDDELGS